MNTAWQVCSVNCGSRCVLKLHVEDGVIRWVESDTLPESGPCPVSEDGTGEGERSVSLGSQMRACLRGRSMKGFLDAPTRLDYPMKRVGKRGEGLFERISWDEALATVAREIERVVSRYGNDAVLIPYGTGLHPAEGSPFERLMNSYGGYLGVYSDYSSAQLQQAMLYTYGDDGYYTGSVFAEAANADMVVLFGNSPLDTRMGGAGAGWEFLRAREAGSFKLVSIDPRHSELLSGFGGEWIPIRPGTDAAFVAGVAYVLIVEGLVDQAFLDRYCVGYDAKTLPPSAAPHASYKDYILGMGPDGVAKTPAWASVITGVPRARIASFAREIAAAKSLFVAQGWGPQRHEMGELTARSILMLPLLTGQVGLPGTNSGARERFLPFVVPEPFVGENPVKAKIPAFMWLEAVKRGAELTDRNAGVVGADALKAPVKMIINHAGNCLTNQHADINATHEVLADESLCELIVVCDIHLTDSARYADILLPDVARAEQENLVSSGSADITRALVRGQDWGAWRADRMPAHEMAERLANMLGVGEAYRAIASSDVAESGEGFSEALGDRARFERARIDQEVFRGEAGSRVAVAVGAEAAIPPTELPSWDALSAGRVWRRAYEGPTIAYANFRNDPEGHPLPTPSGKIEIYSERLAWLAEELEYDACQLIHPLPVYAPGPEGFESPLRKDFPFQVLGYHCRQRTHSSFGSVRALDDVSPQTALINVRDAARLDVQSGEKLLIENERGAMVIAARVTPRIMPGVIGVPQGAWHEADMQGNRVDFGGCINTLTSARPTPLARGNGQHSVLAKVRKVSREEERSLRGSFRLPLPERLAREGEGAGEEALAALDAKAPVRKGAAKGSKRTKGKDLPGKGRVPQHGFRFIQSRCNGCKTCEIACKDYHGLEQEIALRTIYEYAGGSWAQDEDGAWRQDVFCYHLSMSCNHCSNPVCVRFCPAEAIRKQPGGFVVIDHENCGGCQSCMIACPYHAPRFDEMRGVPVKCDGCHDRVLAGGLPVCVEACPQRALEFGVYADMARGEGHLSNMEPLPDSDLTQPNFAIDPSDVALAAQGRDGFVVNIREA